MSNAGLVVVALITWQIAYHLSISNSGLLRVYTHNKHIFPSVHLWASSSLSKGIFDWRWLKKSEMNSILQENEKDTYWLVAQGPNIVSFFLLFSSSQSENGDEFKSDGMTFTHSAEIWTDHVCLLHAFCDNDQVYLTD